MSASDARPVSIELPRIDWERIVGVVCHELACKIENQLPPRLPEGLGAVVEARRDGTDHTELFVRCALKDDEFNFGWRPARADSYGHTTWAHGWQLEVVRVFSEGTKWPA